MSHWFILQHVEHPKLIPHSHFHTFACTVPSAWNAFSSCDPPGKLILQGSCGGSCMEAFPHSPPTSPPSPGSCPPGSSAPFQHSPPEPCSSFAFWVPLQPGREPPGQGAADYPRVPQVRSHLKASLTRGKILFMSPGPSFQLQSPALLSLVPCLVTRDGREEGEAEAPPTVTRLQAVPSQTASQAEERTGGPRFRLAFPTL